MKKYLYSLIAVAAMLFATACSESELASEQSQEVEMSFNLSLEGMSQSRNIGKATKIKTLVYEIRRGDKVVKRETVADAFANSLTYQLKLTVMVGVTYDYIFWAQSPDAPYGIDDLSAIQMNYTNANANDENRDAFYAANSFVGKQYSDEIVLKRPFAQLNVGAQSGIFDDNSLVGVNIENTSVELAEVPSVFHPITGEATDLVNVVMKTTPTPAIATGEKLKITQDGKETEYHYLSLNYFLAHSEKELFSSLIHLYSDPTDLVKSIPVPNIPLHRNYRTNILFSTSGGGGGFVDLADVSFTIIVDPDFDKLTPENPDYVEKEEI